MEPLEINEFAEKMKEGGESALTHISLAISVLAVLVAMVTVLGHRTHTEAILLQSRAGDQWNQYGVKRIRQEQVSGLLDLISLQPSVNSADAQAKAQQYRDELAKLKEDLKEEETKARELESEVDKAEVRASRYDLGEALLQISVVLSSITLLTRKSSYFFLGLLLGLAGLAWSITALFLH